MGYTHYWSQPSDVEGMAKALPTIKKILKRHKDVVQFEDDDPRKPEVTNESIRFNGIGEDAYETFSFNLLDSGYCKTARMPYDIVVCECLLVLKHFMPSLDIGSDGFSGYMSDEAEDFQEDSTVTVLDGEWRQAIENVRQYGINYLPVCTEVRGEYYDWFPDTGLVPTA
jgi:hypothetical protein